MKWFNNPENLEDLKQEYKRLAMKHHPDVGGKDEDMKEINAEYDILFAKLKNVHKTAEGKTYTAEAESTETPEEFRDIIENLIRFKNIKIEICGSWIWVTGKTYEYREQLKGMHFRWSKSKSAWYYHGSEYRKCSNRKFSLDEIRDLYGSQVVNGKSELRMQLA